MGRIRCLLHICDSGKEEDGHELNFPASWVKYMAWKQTTRLASLLYLCVTMEKGPMSGIEYYSGRPADFWPPQEMQWWWISFCMVGASSWQPQFSTGLQGFSIKKTISDTCRRTLKALVEWYARPACVLVVWIMNVSQMLSEGSYLLWCKGHLCGQTLSGFIKPFTVNDTPGRSPSSCKQ